MKRITQLWRIVVVALIIGVPLACFTAAAARMKASNSRSSRFAPILLPVRVAVQVMPPPNSGPGIYAAVPYSMLVIVPQPTDPGMVCVAPDISKFKMSCIQPPMHLERR